MSRKVTTAIVEAFIAGTPLTISNSYVSLEDNEVRLYLFGNLIAKRGPFGLFITNAGWESNTTKERLNGIPGVSISQQKRVWYLNGNAWGGEWIKIK